MKRWSSNDIREDGTVDPHSWILRDLSSVIGDFVLLKASNHKIRLCSLAPFIVLQVSCLGPVSSPKMCFGGRKGHSNGMQMLDHSDSCCAFAQQIFTLHSRDHAIHLLQCTIAGGSSCIALLNVVVVVVVLVVLVVLVVVVVVVAVAAAAAAVVVVVKCCCWSSWWLRESHGYAKTLGPSGNGSTDRVAQWG